MRRFTVEMFKTETGRYSNCRVLTIEEAKLQTKSLTSHTFVGNDQNVMFYSSDHMFGYPILPQCCVPCTVSFHRSVAPRPGFENGMLVTAADEVRFDRHCNPKLRIIESIEELVDYLNAAGYPVGR